MKANTLNALILQGAMLGAVGCASSQTAQPPPVVIIQPQPARPAEQRTYSYNQKVETSKVLFSDQKSRKFISDFSALYSGKGKTAPSFAIRINPSPDGKRTTPSHLDDQQMIADCERYFGRPLRAAGLKVVDEAAMAGANTNGNAGNADIVLNVLVSSRKIDMVGFNGEQVTKFVPDLQVTAIRAADRAIIGQAATVDLIGLRANSWVTVERVGVPEMMRATALVLLEDMVARKFIEEVAALNQAKEELIEKLPSETARTDPSKSTVVAPPQPETQKAIAEIDLGRITLVDDTKLKEQANKLNRDIASLNKKSDEIDLWKVTLVGEDQAKKLQSKDSNHLVKNYVQESYKPD